MSNCHAQIVSVSFFKYMFNLINIACFMRCVQSSDVQQLSCFVRVRLLASDEEQGLVSNEVTFSNEAV